MPEMGKKRNEAYSATRWEGNFEKTLGSNITKITLPGKNTNNILWDSYWMLNTKRVFFQFLNKYIMKKIITTVTESKLE